MSVYLTHFIIFINGNINLLVIILYNFNVYGLYYYALVGKALTAIVLKDCSKI